MNFVMNIMKIRFHRTVDEYISISKFHVTVGASLTISQIFIHSIGMCRM